MSSNLNYTNLSYNEIKNDIVSRLSQDSRFSNFTESQLYAVMMEIFAGTTDFTNFYIERSAEESFMDTAKLRSSIIQLSKMLGYVIRRPIPATTSIKITLKNIPVNAQVGHTINFQKFASFSFNGLNYVLKDSLTYTLTQSDINNFADPNYFKVFEYFSMEDGYTYQLFESQLIPDEFKEPITLVQAEFKTYTISNINTQADQRFQEYKINDKEFSNLFGNEDYGFDIESGNTDLLQNVTRVAVGLDETNAFVGNMSEFDAKSEFIIDRRSFLNDYTIPLLTATDSGKSVKYCVLKTNLDDTVQLKFGDDIVSSIGAKGLMNVYVKYLATKGAGGNLVGIIGKRVELQSNQFSNNFSSSNFLFELRRNSVGGADIEELESIKINAPEIFYSLDRCVTPRDYINFLRTLTVKGKQIKNAIVWGEQEETRDNVFKIPNIKLFNTVLFCVLADMYSKTNGVYTDLEDLDTIVLDTNNMNDYYSLMVLSDSVTPLKTIDPKNEELKSIYKKLYSRSEITVKNVYVSPVIHDFQVAGKIYLNPLVDKNRVYTKVTNAIYEYLTKNADFNTPIYLSNLIDIIEDFSEVNHADISFEPIVNENEYIHSTNTGMEYADISATFQSAPIGHVFYSNISASNKCGTREFSTSATGNGCTDLYHKTFDGILSAYSENLRNVVACLLPNLEIKTYKADGENAITTLIWPSEDKIDSDTCSIVRESSKNINTSFQPSERNLYLGLLNCFYTNLQKIVSRDSTLDVDLSYLETYISNKDNCFCSLKNYKSVSMNVDNGNSLSVAAKCAEDLNNANPTEVKMFIDNNILNIIDLFRNTLSYDIKTGLLDSYGNIVNFSIKNEIARIKAPESFQYVYR